MPQIWDEALTFFRQSFFYILPLCLVVYVMASQRIVKNMIHALNCFWTKSYFADVSCLEDLGHLKNHFLCDFSGYNFDLYYVLQEGTEFCSGQRFANFYCTSLKLTSTVIQKSVLYMS